MIDIFYNIIALAIVVFAFFLLGRKLYLKFAKKDENECSSGCDGCASDCDLRNLKQNGKN